MAERGGLYVHVPYCRRRCPYCDFYFEVRAPHDDFVDAVLAELDARRAELGASAASLSLGGGTPTALGADALARLVRGVRERVELPAGAEVSLEANPEDVTPALARALKDAGFTRVSVGVQSFADDMLSYLGRAHTGARAHDACAALVAAGLDVGIDLIVGVPGERAARVDEDVARCAALGVVHVSTYLLTVEEGTPLERLVRIGKRAPLDDDAQADAYERAQLELGRAGFRQYEVSSHARPGRESAHNRLYWAHAPYLGLGPGAASMRVREDGGVVRRHTTARLDAWRADPAGAAHDEEQLDSEHALCEGVAFGLRDLLRGAALDRLRALHRVHDRAPLDALERALRAAEARGEVTAEGDTWRLTARGARFADRVARDVLAARAPRR